MTERVSRTFAICAVGAAIAWTPIAMAYVGPGSGLSAIGAFLAMLGAIGFAIVGLVWYPLKRLWRFVRSKKDHDGMDN